MDQGWGSFGDKQVPLGRVASSLLQPSRRKSPIAARRAYRRCKAMQGLREDIGNYTSVQEQAEDAEIEEIGQTLTKLGYAVSR